jgi:hypothetical protein
MFGLASTVAEMEFPVRFREITSALLANSSNSAVCFAVSVVRSR